MRSKQTQDELRAAHLRFAELLLDVAHSSVLQASYQNLYLPFHVSSSLNPPKVPLYEDSRWPTVSRWLQTVDEAIVLLICRGVGSERLVAAAKHDEESSSHFDAGHRWYNAALLARDMHRNALSETYLNQSHEHLTQAYTHDAAASEDAAAAMARGGFEPGQTCQRRCERSWIAW